MLPQGATSINDRVGVINQDGHWIYLLGMHPVYRHPTGDQRGFKLTIAQLVDCGACRQVEILTAFGISKSNLDRALRRYRAGGIEAFFKRPARPGKGRVLTPEVLLEAQRLLDGGQTKSAVATQLGVPPDTLRRAVWDGRLSAPPNAGAPPHAAPPDKSQRSAIDAAAAEGLGTACTRTGDRMLAALGALEAAATRFEPAKAVPFGGVLCAVGALMENGLLDPVREQLGQVKGYYGVTHILLLLAFMALCRIKTTEQLRGKAPGELGRLIGLDRVPEVRCLRKKLDAMAANGAAEKWLAALSRQWMEAKPDVAGTLYVDGHVRVYHGGKTKLPRKYVSRQRLCLRGTTDYWVNDCGGLPYFVIDKVVDSGLLDALREDLVPRLLKDVPGQPTAAQLAADPWRCRFTLIFDREGYSPAFFKEMWDRHRIACVTYHKYPQGTWAQELFSDHQHNLPNGESVTLRLAERGSRVGDGKDALWLKEVRKLTASGRQISLVGTSYGLAAGPMATGLFSRWCQENYFRYGTQHFAIDLLGEYKTGPLHDTARVINPAWRELERQRATLESKLRHRRARFAAASIGPPPVADADTPAPPAVEDASPPAPPPVEDADTPAPPAAEDADTPAPPERKAQTPAQLQRKAATKARHEAHAQARRELQQAELLEEIQSMELELAKVKADKKKAQHHIQWADLPEADRFEQPLLGRKRLKDAVGMIAYRAETALCGLLRTPLIDNAAARSLLQDLFIADADLRPDAPAGLLHVEVHRGSRPAVDRALASLFSQLNEMELVFPGTDLTLSYRLVGHPAPVSSTPAEPAPAPAPGVTATSQK